MDVPTLISIVTTSIAVLSSIGTAITVVMSFGKYKEKLEALERAFQGILTHEDLGKKLQDVRNLIDRNVTALYDKINLLKDEAASSSTVNNLTQKIADIRTDLEVLKDGVGRVVDAMSSTEESITALLTESRSDEVRLSTLESFRSEANAKIREVELQLARIGERR